MGFYSWIEKNGLGRDWSLTFGLWDTDMLKEFYFNAYY